MKIDINSDLGEGAGNDEAVMKFISSANIACGYHAGDDNSMMKTILLAIENNLAIGAHPGYADKENFGRVTQNLTSEEVKTLVSVQIKLLKFKVEEKGGKLQHVKPHGALYNQAAKNREIAKSIVEAIYEIDPTLIFVGLANSVMIDEANKIGLASVSEVFADRAYTNNGHLVQRTQAGAVIHDAELCKKRVLRMITHSVVKSIDGIEIPIQADSVCIHGDNPPALELAKSIHNYLLDNEVEIQSMSNIIKYKS